MQQVKIVTTTTTFIIIFRIKYLQRIIFNHIYDLCSRENRLQPDKWRKGNTLPLDRLIAHYAMPFDFLKQHIKSLNRSDLDIERFCYHPNATLPTLKHLLRWHREFKLSTADNSVDILDKVAAVGNLDIIQFLIKTYPHLTCKHAIDLAASNGYVEVVKYLYGRLRRKGGCSTDAIDLASEHGHLSVVEYLLHRKETFTRRAMNKSSENGHLTVVDRLHRAGGRCTKDAMDGAAANGHLSVVEYLHTHRTEGCSIRALDAASKNGYLSVVEYLNSNRSEGCSQFAMDWAASNGHLSVVDYLHRNRTEGCTTIAVDGASRNGFVNIVEYLFNSRTEGCTSIALCGAAANNHFTTVSFLISNNNNNQQQTFTVTNIRDAITMAQGEDAPKIITLLSKYLPPAPQI
ncbi:hypothetical protein DFA_04902 [Cavenderia fasciculata]|uniref:Ankyrin repeat-containing protein n=1 Tax=Cavenderia fasciculata TaxID=261658 RepID=F4PMC2_CACFS|nr:uncharacterized protein DFA_04902 [Cavenderia fasciculata]EGG22772.1 hypothetical protein DFA_04902 [Cavenderia fasciculata]|eukprot:XP_004360623.1 hypothetical protein DFA_04902 [Cavenderia fasciculata]